MVPWLASALINVAASYVIGKIMKPKVPEPDESLTYEKEASLEDFRQPTCEYGTPIAKVFGTCILNGQMLTNSAVDVKEVVTPSNTTYGAGGVGNGVGASGGNIGTSTVNDPTGVFRNNAASAPTYVINYYNANLDKHVYAYPGSTEAIALMGQGYVPFDTFPADNSIQNTVPYTAPFPTPVQSTWKFPP